MRVDGNPADRMRAYARSRPIPSCSCISDTLRILICISFAEIINLSIQLSFYVSSQDGSGRLSSAMIDYSLSAPADFDHDVTGLKESP